MIRILGVQKEAISCLLCKENIFRYELKNSKVYKYCDSCGKYICYVPQADVPFEMQGKLNVNESDLDWADKMSKYEEDDLI